MTSVFKSAPTVDLFFLFLVDDTVLPMSSLIVSSHKKINREGINTEEKKKPANKELQTREHEAQETGDVKEGAEHRSGLDNICL